MTEASSPTPRFPVFLHGGDYNPDQWLDHPEILEQDIELMHKAHVNCVSIAIFAWARLKTACTTSRGWTKSSTDCGAAASTSFWQRRRARVRRGWRRSTPKSCA